MEKENNNNFMLKFSRIFSSSCITQDISTVIDHQKLPVFTPKTPLMEQEEEEEEDENLFPYPVIRPNKQTPLLTCKPRCPESFDQMVRESCLITRRKVAGRYSLLSPAGEFSGRRCPPVSPASPLFQRETKKKPKKKKKKKKKQRSKNGGFSNNLEKTHFKNHNPFSFSSSNETDWFSSDDEREEDEEQQHETEKTTLFPSSNQSVSLSSKSISLSSDSETRIRNRARNRRRRANLGPGPSRVRSKREEMEVVPLQGKVKDTFAVVKSSSDPYNDFRTSMVEMIIEKQIFGERELEQLLQCFLSLNSSHHHPVIMEVFTEIWDALFSYRS